MMNEKDLPLRLYGWQCSIVSSFGLCTPSIL